MSRTPCAPAGSSSVQQPCGPADSLDVADPNPYCATNCLQPYCATTCLQPECKYSICGMHPNPMPSLFSQSPHCPLWSGPVNAPLTVRAQVPMAQPVSVNNMGGGGYGGGYGGIGHGGGYGGSDVTVQVSFAFITTQSLMTLTQNPADRACNERKA